MADRTPTRIVPFAGSGEMRSALFSRTWELRKAGSLIAVGRRHVWQRRSEVALIDGRRWLISPTGWGVGALTEWDEVLARGERQNWLGRAWGLNGESFGYELRARSMTLRKWSIDLGGGEIARLDGGVASFNRMRIEADLPLPLEAVMLSWHIIVRAWEAAASAAAAGGS
ncbi:MAG: hypothetical protein ACXW1Y_09670 [Acidimicrobiia bacterium]